MGGATLNTKNRESVKDVRNDNTCIVKCDERIKTSGEILELLTYPHPTTIRGELGGWLTAF